jgi:hypothetical protein
MANLHRLEAPGDPHTGGVLAEFPSGRRLQAAWRHAESVDSMATAKRVAASLLERLLAERLTDDAERTNWPSLVAAVQVIVRDWDAKRQTVDNRPENG